MTWYPLRPLANELGWPIKQLLATYQEGTGRRVRRDGRRNSVNELDADRLATYYGHHLWEVWPDRAANERECARLACSEMFPRQGKKRYCTPRCQAAEYQRIRRASDPEYAQRLRDASRRYEAANRKTVNRTKAAWQRSRRRRIAAETDARWEGP